VISSGPRPALCAARLILRLTTLRFSPICVNKTTAPSKAIIRSKRPKTQGKYSIYAGWKPIVSISGTVA
jgi:hypothetical protein